MATNYNVYEAVKILADRNDFEKIGEIHRRFPYLSDFATRVITKAPDEFMSFMEFIPEHITANKVNGNMKKRFEGATLEEAADNNVVEASKQKKPAKEDDAAGNEKSEYSKMPAGKLKEIIKEKGLEDACRSKFGRINHDNMVKTLEAYDAGDLDVDEQGDDEEVEAAGKYDGIAAPALFKMCKDRGIKAKPKQPAKFYVELLEAADAEAEKTDDDDDWDDDTQDRIEEAVAKSEAITAEDDDDEDWDI